MNTSLTLLQLRKAARHLLVPDDEDEMHYYVSLISRYSGCSQRVFAAAERLGAVVVVAARWRDSVNQPLMLRRRRRGREAERDSISIGMRIRSDTRHGSF